MARYTGPKNRLMRREGVNLGLKSESKLSVEKRLNVPPGQHGGKGRRRVSEFGQQLREKQKAKRLYGVLERQFKKYYHQASKRKGATGEALFEILESRLDNVIYRLGFAPTRAMARQLVSHKHVLVDGKKVNIPSFLVRPGVVVSLDSKAISIPIVGKLLEEKDKTLPDWLERSAAVGKVNRLPNSDEIPTEIDKQLIVEYYSR